MATSNDISNSAAMLATDWLKDYDPLFDLFDEEMRAHQVMAGHQQHLDYFNEFDLNNHYNPMKQQDELSLILGLEWLPHREQLCASPTTPVSSQRRKKCHRTKGTSLLAQPMTINTSNNTNGNSCTFQQAKNSSANSTSCLSCCSSCSSSSPPPSIPPPSSHHQPPNVSATHQATHQPVVPLLLTLHAQHQANNSNNQLASYNISHNRNHTLIQGRQQHQNVIRQQQAPIINSFLPLYQVITTTNSSAAHLADKPVRYCVHMEHAYCKPATSSNVHSFSRSASSTNNISC